MASNIPPEMSHPFFRFLPSTCCLILLGCVDPAAQQREQAAGEMFQRKQQQAQADAKAKAQSDRDAYIGAHPALTDEIKAAIHAGNLAIGMSESDVTATLGHTWLRANNRTTTAYGTSDQWVLNDGRYLYFDNGILTSMQTTN